MGEDEFDSAYPRQGQYGHTGQRCKWCGRPIQNAQICGVYCTPMCCAADNYAGHICLELLLVILAVGLFWIFSLGEQPSSQIFDAAVVFIVLVTVILLMLCCLMGARKMRKKSGLWC